MPVDRTLSASIAETVARLYHDLEMRLAEAVARQLRAGIAEPADAERQIAALGTLSLAAQRMVLAIVSDVTGTVEQAVVLAYQRGGEAAVAELAKRGGISDAQLAELRQTLPQLGAIQRLVYALVSTLQGTHVRILRWPLDAYREVIARAVATGTLVGQETRLRTAQRAWDQLLGRGITGFTDRAGRNWELASYVEMATRTTTAQAAVQGNLDRLGDAGINLVIVSNAPQECVRCRPWEGKILDRLGAGGRRTVEVRHATQDRMIRVEVAGSVTEAVAAGLMHPNCRHSLSAYLPGITKIPTHTEDPEGDEARQKLRALERKVRKEKLKAAAALTPETRRAHEARVRELQTEIRDHIATAPTQLFRQRQREQIGTAR
ncbi:phage minor capsid protein [Amycolatopsis taiwanensis]|uniref:phage minor capsid protein n=1 Tax=Amycolatopsis taiwanensis TaxID=342230 RepID=UPI00048892AA|nr:phage minor capsid protein [Amycolatopsis taiwanensis]